MPNAVAVLVRRWSSVALLAAAVWPAAIEAQQYAAQPPLERVRPFPPLWDRPWWNNRLVQDLNLSDAQKNDIKSTLNDYRTRMMELRSAIQKADADVGSAFAENPVDQKKANDAIERLVAARADLTRSLTQMSLKLRTILTVDQWQELQRRQPARDEEGRGRFNRGPGNPPVPPNAPKQ